MARKWFTPETTSGLTADDMTILNRAARNLFDVPSNLELMNLRMLYKPGMSAKDLMDAYEDRD